MATICSKLTVAYAGALIGSIAVFSVAVYAARRSNARREAPRGGAVQAAQALRAVRLAARADAPVTAVRGSLVVSPFTPRVAGFLDGLPGYMVMFDADGRAPYVSPARRALRAHAQSATEIGCD